MEFLIFSDSHGHSSGMKLAWERQRKMPDVLIHLGDGLHDLSILPDGTQTVLRVRGNCDVLMEDAPMESLFSAEGHLLFLTHGAKYGVKGGVGGLLLAAVESGADLVLYGHTHRPVLEVVPSGTTVGNKTLSRPVYLFNPGSIGYNSDGDGKSFGTLTLTRDTVLFSHGRI